MFWRAMPALPDFFPKKKNKSAAAFCGYHRVMFAVKIISLRVVHVVVQAAGLFSGKGASYYKLGCGCDVSEFNKV